MNMQTPEGDSVARHIAAALVQLTELEKTSAVDADTLWRMLAAHLRSQRPQALMTTEAQR